MEPQVERERIFLSKAVRDLHWVLASPHMLSAASCAAAVGDSWCSSLVERSLAWLRELDREPAHLEQWLQRQDRYYRPLVRSEMSLSSLHLEGSVLFYRL